MIYFSHPTGNANVRAALKGLVDAHLLSRFYTTIASTPSSLFYKTSYLPFLSEIRRRAYDASLEPYIKSYPFQEIARLLSSKAGFSKLVQHETGFFSIDRIYQQLDRIMAKEIRNIQKAIKAVYCYEDSAAFSFTEAKRKNIKCLYDLPIGYWRTAHKLLEEERERWPEWASTLTSFKDSSAKLIRKDEELRLADYIFVASSFTAKTLNDYPGQLAPVKVVPYGFPPVFEQRDYTESRKRKTIKVLFVGGLSQRKGIANLFAAVEPFRKYIELTVVGHKVTKECAALDKELAKHRWIPSLSHDDILRLMREQDVLVFPSLFEGFGLVITEAMSQGTPVLTTDRTAGPDLIEHDKDGWIVKAGETHQLIETLQFIIDNPKLVHQIGRAAMEKAKKRNWNMYGCDLSNEISASLSIGHKPNQTTLTL